MKTRDKIIALIAEDGKLSAAALAEKIGISAKAVEKQLAKLKAEGIIDRKGPAKGGEWVVKKPVLNPENVKIRLNIGRIM